MLTPLGASMTLAARVQLHRMEVKLMILLKELEYPKGSVTWYNCYGRQRELSLVFNMVKN